MARIVPTRTPQILNSICFNLSSFCLSLHDSRNTLRGCSKTDRRRTYLLYRLLEPSYRKGDYFRFCTQLRNRVQYSAILGKRGAYPVGTANQSRSFCESKPAHKLRDQQLFLLSPSRCIYQVSLRYSLERFPELFELSLLHLELSYRPGCRDYVREDNNIGH
jgi:hypothetical protein